MQKFKCSCGNVYLSLNGLKIHISANKIQPIVKLKRPKPEIKEIANESIELLSVHSEGSSKCQESEGDEKFDTDIYVDDANSELNFLIDTVNTLMFFVFWLLSVRVF